MTKPIRKGKTLIDHICSNISSKLIHGDAIHTHKVADHDCPNTILDIKKERFETFYKYIWLEKNLKMNNHISYFKKLQLILRTLLTNLMIRQTYYIIWRINVYPIMLQPKKWNLLAHQRRRWRTQKSQVQKNHLENLRNSSHDSNHTEPSTRQSYKLQGITIRKPYDPKNYSPTKST